MGDIMEKKNSLKFVDVFDIILVFFLLILSIKKGGFYKSDTIAINLLIQILFIIRIIYYHITTKSKYEIDMISILLLLLTFCYTLPIIFKNYSNLADSIFEMIRYFNIYLIYKMVKISNNKKIYKNGIIIIAVILAIFGIDGLGKRIFENMLGLFNSGYLDSLLTRMSSTLQYANVLAIILMIAVVFLEEKIVTIPQKDLSQILLYILNYIAFFIVSLSIALTMSRVVLLIYVIYMCYILVKNKNIKVTSVMILQTLVIIVYTVIVQDIINMSSYKIYVITAIFVMINAIIALGIVYLKSNSKIKSYINCEIFRNRKYINCAAFVILFICILYIIIALNIGKELTISQNAKEKVRRTIYNLDETNTIQISLKKLEQDSRYTINVYEQKTDGTSSILKIFNYYEKSTDEFTFEYTKTNLTKSIVFEFDCYKGKISVNSLNINNKKEILNYLLLPTDIVFKIKDSLHFSTSIKDRIDYVQDAIKIFNLSVKNKIIGVGGEGFKHLYSSVQEREYSSTEVHSSYIQILVESGVLGFICIISIIALALFKFKNNEEKIALIILLIHSIVDLDFSYMIILAIFAVLLGICNKKEKKYTDKKIYKYILGVEYIILAFLFVVTTSILIRANYAYYMNIPVYTENNLNLQNQANKVSLLEKRVMLDFSEIKYRNELNSGYNEYLKLLEENNKTKKDIVIKGEISNIIENIKNNADISLKYDRYNKDTVINVCNIYFNNIYNLVNKYYNENKEEGYIVYLNFIIDNLENLRKNHKYKSNIQTEINKLYKRYYDNLIENKDKLDFSENVNNIINIFLQNSVHK